MKRQYSSVSVDVMRHLRSENERLLTAAREVEARLERGPLENRISTMLELSHGLRNHLALVEGLLDALTVDHPSRPNPGQSTPTTATPPTRMLWSQGVKVASESEDDRGGPGNAL